MGCVGFLAMINGLWSTLRGTLLGSTVFGTFLKLYSGIYSSSKGGGGGGGSGNCSTIGFGRIELKLGVVKFVEGAVGPRDIESSSYGTN